MPAWVGETPAAWITRVTGPIPAALSARASTASRSEMSMAAVTVSYPSPFSCRATPSASCWL